MATRCRSESTSCCNSTICSLPGLFSGTTPLDLTPTGPRFVAVGLVAVSNDSTSGYHQSPCPDYCCLVYTLGSTSGPCSDLRNCVIATWYTQHFCLWTLGDARSQNPTLTTSRTTGQGSLKFLNHVSEPF